MSDSISAYYDDIEEYNWLCKHFKHAPVSTDHAYAFYKDLYELRKQYEELKKDGKSLY